MALAALALLAMAAGCDATKPTTAASTSSAMSSAMTTSSSTGSASSMSGMGTTSPSKGAAMPVAMPIVPLASTTWEGMKIEARAMAPVPFVVVTGTSEKEVRPSDGDDMHLMVMLTDAETGVDIPYATVWATVRQGSKIVYDNRQWPMLSRYMGAHYGNDVALPGPGTYNLSLLIGPPQSARHMEYAKVWLKPHRVEMTFKWPGTTKS
jgi:uncharacterized protein involved in high-affinity Fe2+ transport